MRSWLKTFFGFSQREMNGIRVLFAAIVAMTLIPHVAKRWAGQGVSIDAATRTEISQFFASMQQPEKDGTAETSTLTVYTDFDPNQLDRAGWRRLGFTERQAAVILNYTAKGGQFRRKEDLKKIYSVSEADYLRVADFIVIPDNVYQRSVTDRPVREEHVRYSSGADRWQPAQNLPHMIEINGADSFAFQQLPGIGPVFASRIVRFRERLGGFHHVSQLQQVYGMDSVRFDGIAGQLEVDTTLIRRIKVNQADYEELRVHPFIGHKLASLIVRYREQHGPFATAGDLGGIQVVDDDFLRNIAPYLEF